jgi:hypothetical protein
MISGYMVPSFSSSVVKLRLFNCNLLYFTLFTLITELVEPVRYFNRKEELLHSGIDPRAQNVNTINSCFFIRKTLVVTLLQNINLVYFGFYGLIDLFIA